MRVQLFFGLAVVLLVSAGCGPSKPGPSGAVYQGKHVSEWGDQMKSPDKKARLEAAQVLVAMGKEGTSTKEAIQKLQQAVKDEDPEVRGWAAVALVYAARGTPFPIGPIAQPALKEAAESSDPELRAQASEMVNRVPAGGGSGPPGGAGANRGEDKGGTERSATDEKKTPPDEKKTTTEKEKP
jgi:HEAT repeat protein